MTQKFSVDTTAVMALAKVIQETGLTEIEYEVGDARIRVAKEAFHGPVVHHATPAPQPIPVPNLSTEGAIKHTTDYDAHPGAVKSPMVGTAYTAPSPGAAPYVSVGDSVSVGQTIMIIEAMKVMNPIKSTKAGKVTQILVNDAEPVEFGEVLIIVE